MTLYHSLKNIFLLLILTRFLLVNGTMAPGSPDRFRSAPTAANYSFKPFRMALMLNTVSVVLVLNPAQLPSKAIKF